jgi:2-isopropylmalate synthase
MLKDARTYQIIDPAEVGALMTLPLGKHSGRHAFARACSDAGLDLDAAALSAAFVRFKTLADTQGDVPLAHVFQEVPAQ